MQRFFALDPDSRRIREGDPSVLDRGVVSEPPYGSNTFG